MEMVDKDNGTQKKAFYVVNKANDENSTKNTILRFLYNKETHAICGRTIMSWLKITVFYIIFYICLAIFALAMFSLFWKLTIVPERPRWIGADGLIGSTPGVGFRPMPDQDKNAESTLIWINRKNDFAKSFWADGLDEFLTKNYVGRKGKDCDYDNGAKADDVKGCDVDIDSFANCAQGSGYGYTNGRGQPCVLVKLNKIYDWVPDSFSGDDLPPDMPPKLQEKIRSLPDTSTQLSTIWITCQPENVADREQVGKIEYYNPGSKEPQEFGMIPNYYFPYKNQEKFESPFVFVRFPELMRSVLIQLECRAWARNIKYSRQFRVGSTHFELMVD